MDGGVATFLEMRSETVEIHDISRKLACLLKARLEHDAKWKAFAAKAGQTKCDIQQTELAYLFPPSQRSKPRFMNLGPLIAWGYKTLVIFDNPSPEVLQYVTPERLEEKLGSLRQFRKPLRDWSEMQPQIDVVVDFVRTQGLYRSVAKDLRNRLCESSVGQIARQVGKDLVKFVAEHSGQLRSGERLPGSSEVIETCFGKFKSMEREKAAGGFTSLPMALAASVAKRAQEVVHEAFQKTKTEDVVEWMKTKLGATVGSERRAADRAPTARVTKRSESNSDTKAEGRELALAV